jgi:excisionase family DNA binding protein
MQAEWHSTWVPSISESKPVRDEDLEKRHSDPLWTGWRYRQPVTFGRLRIIDQVALPAEGLESGQTMTRVSECVKVSEAATILGVSEKTVRAWAESGKLSVHRNSANGYRLFRQKDLETFLQQLAKTRTHPSKH